MIEVCVKEKERERERESERERERERERESVCVCDRPPENGKGRPHSVQYGRLIVVPSVRVSICPKCLDVTLVVCGPVLVLKCAICIKSFSKK